MTILFIGAPCSRVTRTHDSGYSYATDAVLFEPRLHLPVLSRITAVVGQSA
jgi:hypothetical protein